MLTKEEARQLLFWFDDVKFNTTIGPEEAKKDIDIKNILSALNKLHKFCGMEQYKPWWTLENK